MEPISLSLPQIRQANTRRFTCHSDPDLPTSDPTGLRPGFGRRRSRSVLTADTNPRAASVSSAARTSTGNHREPRKPSIVARTSANPGSRSPRPPTDASTARPVKRPVATSASWDQSFFGTALPKRTVRSPL